MGIGILIVAVGSLIYKSRGKIKNIFTRYRAKFWKKNLDYSD